MGITKLFKSVSYSAMVAVFVLSAGCSGDKEAPSTAPAAADNAPAQHNAMDVKQPAATPAPVLPSAPAEQTNH